MTHVHRLLGIALVVISSHVYAQNSDPKAADSGSKSADGTSSTSQTPSQPFHPPEILTDTMGVDFGPYIDQVVKKVKKNWYSLMPPSVYPPVRKQGKVAIEFFIQKDGSVKKMKLDTPPGDVALDRTAWASITTSSRFAALPKEFPGQELGLRFCFYYNPPKESR